MEDKIEHNTPELWDSLWDAGLKSQKEYYYDLLKEEQGPVWMRIKDFLKKKYGTIKGLKAVEIGAGMGSFSALMAKHGAEVTMLDYSEKAISKANEFFDYLSLKMDCVLGDALKLENSLIGKFDVSMSFGLSEHFLNQERLMINKSHFDVLRNNGVTFISVPNKYCIPYQIWRKKREFFKKWEFGYESPYSRNEFRRICKKLQINDYLFIGSPFLSSFNFILPFNTWKNSLTKRLFKGRWLNPKYIRSPRTTFLDEYLGYALILCAEKSKNS